MNQPYQLIIDVWEGNLELDVETIRANGVAGAIVRLNSMSGGHHLDARFSQNWEIARRFEVQTVYFVYNPWVSGQANAEWLLNNLPADFGYRRVMADIEVTYPGYSPVTYQVEVEKFIQIVQAAGLPVTIYTGAWFMDRLGRWPEDVDYWWAAYPTLLTATRTWADYRRVLEGLSYAAFTDSAPGPARLWQCTGDGCVLPGFSGHAVDVSTFPGTLEECRNYFGIEETTMGKWATNARLAHYDDTHTLVDPDDLAGYDGAVIWLGRVAPDVKMSAVAPNQLQIVADAGKPALGFFTWGFDYTHGMSANPVTWPNETQDIVIKNFLDAAIFMGDPALNKKRGYSGLIIDVSITNQVFGNNPIYLDQQWVREFAIKHIADIVWKRYKLPVYIYFTPATFNLVTYQKDLGPQSLTEYFKTLTQANALSMPLFGTPGADGRPADAASPVRRADGILVMASGYWWFWLYWYDPLEWLFYGTKEKLYSDLNFSTETPLPPPPPPPPSADLAEALARIAALEGAVGVLEGGMMAHDVRIGELERWRRS